MSHPRIRLPNRRPIVTCDLVWQDPVTLADQHLVVSIGFDPVAGHPVEVFAGLARQGSMLDLMLAEACISISHELQCGRKPADLAQRYGMTPDGLPFTPLGAVMALVVREHARAEGAA